MQPWEILKHAIPRKNSDKVGKLLGIGGNYVRKWRREPESGDAPTASGQRSILDRICELIDAVFLVNPGGCALIVNFIVGYHQHLLRTHALPIESHACAAGHVSKLLVETTEAVNQLNIEGCNEETLIQLVEMRDAADATIQSVQKTLQLKDIP